MAKSNEDALHEIRAKLAQQDLAARREFLEKVETLSVEEAHARTPLRRVSVGPFEAYVAQQDLGCRLLSVVNGGVELFPAFQWHEGKLVPLVSVVCRMFDHEFTRWQTAFWFVGPNSWLRGAAPIDLMRSQPEEVMLAAHYEWIAVAVPTP